MSLVNFSSHIRPLLRAFAPLKKILNELAAEVPLVRQQQRLLSPLDRRLPPPRQSPTTRLVHSVGVSVEQPLLGAARSSSECWSSGGSRRSSLVTKDVEMPTGKPFERLPDTVKPKHYVLSLAPDLKAHVFDGDVAVQIEVVKKTKEIVLNAIDLEISNVSLKGNDALEAPKTTDFCVNDETVTFVFENPIPPGSYSLTMNFKGHLNDKMKGLYRSKYQNQQGEERYAAVTQFEATDARRCFPCWDEPALKATFDISLSVPKDLVALSNMPVKQQKELGELIRYDFETTPIMSTYLVACVVGEYDYVEDKSADGVVVRVYTPRGKKEQGLFALEVATKVLPYYKDYFDIAYPLPKIDLIAIADFSAGAMENWGLVTYRETCLLVDSQNTSAVQKQWIALVVGHELAHQWFGNLVTMEWWTHLWLNEGYASFVEYLCVDHLFPEYDIWKQFVNDTYIRALELDCLKNSHPIEVPVGHPSEIDEIFDDISYNKGASVIRMLHNYIGDQDFRKGMHLYLTRHQYKNTFTEDLWAALEEASKKPVGAVMSTWTKQMGFPVIKVTSKSHANNKGVVLTLSQSKYTADGSKPSADLLWMIPVSITTSKHDKAISTVLKTKEAEVEIPDVGPDDWIKVNPGTVGFYRTQYEPKLLERFIPAIKDRSLPPLDRLGLLDDLFAMVQAGHTNTVEVLKLLQAYEDETDYTVWSSINNVLVKLNMLLSYTDCVDDFKKYQKKMLSKVSKRLGWNPKPKERHLDTLLRGLVLGRLSWLDDDATIAEAKKRFEAHVNSSQTLPADLRSACYKTVLRAGGEDVYNALLKLYRSVDLHEEKDRISRALGATKDTEILSKVLKFAISDEVRAQDTVFVIISVAMSKVGRELAWRFFVDNWTLFNDRYKGYLLTRLVKFVAENFASEASAKEVEDFFKTHDISGTERTVQQAVETIRLNAAWLQRDTDAIRDYLGSN